MPMKNPPHPGHSIKDACLNPVGLSVTEGAEVLGVARHTLSRVINGQAGISPEMAIRMETAGYCRNGATTSSAEACIHRRKPAFPQNERLIINFRNPRRSATLAEVG